MVGLGRRVPAGGPHGADDPPDTFGTLDFAGGGEHRSLTLRLHDDTGKTRLEQVLLAGQLKN